MYKILLSLICSLSFNANAETTGGGLISSFIGNLVMGIVFLAILSFAAFIIYWRYTEYKYRWAWTATCPACNKHHSSNDGYICRNCGEGKIMGYQIRTQVSTGCIKCNDMQLMRCQNPECNADLRGVMKIPFMTRLFLKIFINKFVKLFKI